MLSDWFRNLLTEMRIIMKNGNFLNQIFASFWLIFSVSKLRNLQKYLINRGSRFENYSFNPMLGEWDNLLILDAMRMDYFVSTNTIPGITHPVISNGNSSSEFILNSFESVDLRDVIYLTANPHHFKLKNHSFFKIVDATEQWSESYGITLPHVMVDLAKEIIKKHPDKKLIIHLMQPHQPYIGSLWERLVSDPQPSGLPEYQASGISAWTAAKTRLVTKFELRSSYRQNCIIAVEFAKKLVSQLDGKSVITADHGENLGEKYYGIEIYGHGYHSHECRIVPWHSVPYSSRRKVSKSTPQPAEINESELLEKLQDLGYK